MNRELPVSTDQTKVIACVKRIAKAIGKEDPTVAAAACLMVIEFSMKTMNVPGEDHDRRDSATA